MASTDPIPSDLAARIAAAMGCAIAEVRARGGGGASRQGAEVGFADGRRGYLAWDLRAAEPARMPFHQREVAILSALSGPLAAAGVRVPRFLASDAAHHALLTELTPGDDRFDRTGDKPGLAAGYMAQLAALHRIPGDAVPLGGYGDPGEPPSDRIARQIAELRALNVASGPDAILLLALDWLAAHIPPDTGPSVIVHGDAGPGNFLHRDGQVTALLDWELTHFGDPAEDIAACWIRSLIQPFIPIRDAVAAYAAAGGNAPDLQRLKFHRLYFQMGFMVPGHALAQKSDGPRTPNLGMSMMFSTMHRRIVVESLAELTGDSLPAVDIPDVPPPPGDRLFAYALDDLRDDIVPAIASQHAAASAKSLARMVKLWRSEARWGAAFAAAECREAGAVLGATFDSPGAARLALGRAVAEGAIGRAEALRLCHARVARDTVLMADAMGALARTALPPLW